MKNSFKLSISIFLLSLTSLAEPTQLTGDDFGNCREDVKDAIVRTKMLCKEINQDGQVEFSIPLEEYINISSVQNISLDNDGATQLVKMTYVSADEKIKFDYTVLLTLDRKHILQYYVAKKKKTIRNIGSETEPKIVDGPTEVSVVICNPVSY